MFLPSTFKTFVGDRHGVLVFGAICALSTESNKWSIGNSEFQCFVTERALLYRSL